MPTLKIQKADGTFEFIQLAGEEFADIGNQVLDVKSQLAQTETDLEQRGINVKSFGAVGDGVTDDTLAIKNAIASLNAGNELLFPKSIGRYCVNETIFIPRTVKTTMVTGLLYKGLGNEPCIVVGEAGQETIHPQVLDVRREVISDWENENDIGIKIINSYSNNIKISAYGFTIGCQLVGDGRGFVYNNIDIGHLRDNKYPLELTNLNSGHGIGWVNENVFVGGRFSNLSNTHLSKKRYGVRITSKDGSYKKNNNNNFIKPSFELGSLGVPVLIEHGQLNRFEKCRNESNSNIFAEILDDSLFTNDETNSYNEFDVGFGSVTINDQSTHKMNFTNMRRALSNINVPKTLLFDAGRLIDRYVNADGLLHLKGLFLATSTNGNPVNTVSSGVTISGDKINLASSRAILVKLNTSEMKQFSIVSEGDAIRFGVRTFDSLGNNITSNTTSHATGTPATGIPFQSEFGGCYRSGLLKNIQITVSDETHYVHLMLQGQGLVSAFKIFSNHSIGRGYVFYDSTFTV